MRVDTKKTGNKLTQNITAKSVNIIFPEPRPDRDGKGFRTTEGIQNFLRYVDNFDKDYYVLVVDRQTGINELDAFALVDWIAVIDFDPESRISGLLSYVEESISHRRSLHIISWQDEKCTFSDNSVYWIGIKGNASQPDTKTNDDFQTWKRQIKPNFLQQLKQLKRFGDVYTNITVVAIWPRESLNSKHFYFVLNEMSDTLCPRRIVIVDEGCTKTQEAESVFKMLIDDFPSSVKLDQVGICSAISCVCRPLGMVSSSHYQLPTSDSTNDPKIDHQKAQWLKEDLHVLYLTNETGVEYDTEGMKDEELNFFKGGTLPWAWWYQVGPGRVDIQRDILQDMVIFIKSKFIALCRSGCIKLFHNPGSGGTTLSQRIAWALKNDIPCVQLKHQGSSAITDIAGKIQFLSDKTRMPIFVLVDGCDEQKVDSLRGILGGHCCVIILYVKRYHMKITHEEPYTPDVFWLKSSLSKSEAKNLQHLYSKHYSTERQKRNIEYLIRDGKCHSVFDFGFAMYSYKYKGIESYVRGYLKLDTDDSQIVKVTQKALAYLSLVYYYGQASLPCKFFAYLLEMDNADDVTTLSDIQDDVKQLLVRDVQNRRKNFVRIAHFYIAKEILDQVLVYPMTIERALAPTLNTESKKCLECFAVEFIEKAGKQNQCQASSTISHIMTRTFILRDDKPVGENETHVTKKRQRFSQILEDATSNPPYTERFSIYQALANSFPLEAQFKAHLGRLYSHCRPDETVMAEKCFKEAIEICEQETMIDYTSECMTFDGIPFNYKLDLMHIYHMYGNMILKQVAKYTGKYLGDRPLTQTKGRFDETAKMLLSKVEHACELFSKCRTITPIGCEGSFGYIGEIQVRLMFCDYVHRNSGNKGGICKYIDNNTGELVKFVKGCIPIVDELFLSCFYKIEPEKMDINVFNCIHWHSALFKKGSAKTDRRIANDAMSRRLEIAKVKMKYCQPNSYGILEHVNDEEDVEFIVQELEKNFKDYENKGPETLPTKTAMDLDYREWLFAIRHNLFKENYAVDRVLQQVQLWHDTLHTPYSLFYLFVLKSVHGMGNSSSQGDAALLQDAQKTKEEMLKRSKYLTKPRYPREWLGKSENNIRQLVPGLRFFGQMEGRDIIDFEKLEIKKGTICAPNDKPAGGYIDLDLGPDNAVPIKVFFVPARSEGNLKGPSYTNTRVEFVIGFSVSHGYEAFNVKPIELQKCPKCKKNVEKRTCDMKVKCPRCQIWISIEGLKKQAKQSRNGSSKI